MEPAGAIGIAVSGNVPTEKGVAETKALSLAAKAGGSGTGADAGTGADTGTGAGTGAGADTVLEEQVTRAAQLLTSLLGCAGL